jgi:hypothetical protein
MSANWIKWSKGLANKREVVVLASRFKRDRHEIAGRLMELWEWCDDNLDDVDFDGDDAIVSLGNRDSAIRIIDEHTGIKGMAVALESAGVEWLKIGNGKRVRFKRYRRHNGKTAKERATEQRKKSLQRSSEKADEPLNSPGTNGTLPGPEAEAEAEADEGAIATAQCMDRGMQGGKVSARIPQEFAPNMDSFCGYLNVNEPDQFGFLARLAYADAVGFELPKPVLDYIGRAKKKRNMAGWLKTAVRADLGERWQEFLDSTPSEAHCQALLAKAGLEAS